MLLSLTYSRPIYKCISVCHFGPFKVIFKGQRYCLMQMGFGLNVAPAIMKATVDATLLKEFMLMRAWFQQLTWKSTWLHLIWPARIQNNYGMTHACWVCMWNRITHLNRNVKMTFHQFLRSSHNVTSCGVENWWAMFLCVVGFVLQHHLLNAEQYQSHLAGSTKWQILPLRTWLGT